MSRGRTPVRKIRDVLRYKQEHGLSNERIAGALGLSKGSVHNILERFAASGLAWPLPAQMSDSELESALYKRDEPPTEKSPHLPDVQALERELRKPHVTLQLLFEEYRAAQPEGLGRTAFYEHFERHRSQKPDMKFIHKGGDKLFVDYSGDGPEYVDRSTGEIFKAQLFVCSWGASSYSYAEATATQRAEDFVDSHVHAFAYFGVVPHALVPDNLKSGVDKACRYEPVLNRLYHAMSEHYGTVVLPARVATPKDKAVVESNVLHVQRFILGRLRNRTYFALTELNEAIAALLAEYNARPMKDYGGQTRHERFLELDRPYARALCSERFRITHIEENVRVAPNYHFRYRDHYYSVPEHLARHRVDVYHIGPILEVYHDHRHVARHLVSLKKYAYTTVAEHMPSEHAFVQGWSKEYFTREALAIGTATAEVVKRTMERQQHVQQGFNAALGILRLAKSYSAQRLERACERALHFGSPTYRSIRSILEQGLDQQPLDSGNGSEPALAVNHDNIRGANYYSDDKKEQTPCIPNK